MIKETITPMSLRSADGSDTSSAAAKLAGNDADKGLFARIMALMDESSADPSMGMTQMGTDQEELNTLAGLNTIRISAPQEDGEGNAQERLISSGEETEESEVTGVIQAENETAISEEQQPSELTDTGKKDENEEETEASDSGNVEAEVIATSGAVTDEKTANGASIDMESADHLTTKETEHSETEDLSEETSAGAQGSAGQSEEVLNGNAEQNVKLNDKSVSEDAVKQDLVIPEEGSKLNEAEVEAASPSESDDRLNSAEDANSGQGAETSALKRNTEAFKHSAAAKQADAASAENRNEVSGATVIKEDMALKSGAKATESAGIAEDSITEEAVKKNGAKENEKGRTLEGERKESFAALMNSRSGSGTGRQGDLSEGSQDHQSFFIGRKQGAGPAEEINFKEQFKEVTDTDSNKAEESVSGFVKLGEMNISNVMLRDRVVPGLTRAVQHTASTPKAEQAEWQQHVFEMEDGQKVEMSTRNVDGVIQVKIASGNSELGKLIQMYSDEIREYLEKECEVSVDLQFEDNSGSAGTSEGGDTGNNSSANSRFAGTGGSDPKGLSRQQEQKIHNSIRRFGYNRMEWTA